MALCCQGTASYANGPSLHREAQVGSLAGAENPTGEDLKAESSGVPLRHHPPNVLRPERGGQPEPPLTCVVRGAGQVSWGSWGSLAWEQPEGQVCGRQEAALTGAHVRLGCSGCGNKGDKSAWRHTWENQVLSCLCSHGCKVGRVAGTRGPTWRAGGRSGHPGIGPSLHCPP